MTRFASSRFLAQRDPNLIESVVLTGTAATVEFRDIPQWYLDLRILVMARSDRAANDVDGLLCRFGTGGSIDSGNNYDVFSESLDDGGSRNRTDLQATNAMHIGRGAIAGSTNAANAFAPCVVDIPAYRGASFKASIASAGLTSADTTGGSTRMSWSTGAWRNTGPIDSIDVFPEVGPNFVSGTEIRLYGHGFAP